MNRFFLFLASILLLTATACSTMRLLNPFSSSEEDQAAAEGETEAEPEAAAEEQAANTEEEAPPVSRVAKALEDDQGNSSVEVLWQVPLEAVEKYHLYYGLDAAQMENHIEVPVAELQKIDHPKHGPVYRYELRQIPAHRAIYLSLRAENKYGMSDPSPATKVEPGQRTVTP